MSDDGLLVGSQEEEFGDSEQAGNESGDEAEQQDDSEQESWAVGQSDGNSSDAWVDKDYRSSDSETEDEKDDTESVSDSLPFTSDFEWMPSGSADSGSSRDDDDSQWSEWTEEAEAWSVSNAAEGGKLLQLECGRVAHTACETVRVRWSSFML